jgi:hypothetical protein
VPVVPSQVGALGVQTWGVQAPLPVQVWSAAQLSAR